MKRSAAACLEAMGVERWALRDPPHPHAAASALREETAAPAPSMPAAAPAAVEPSVAPSDEAAWTQLREAVAGCTRCPLHATRTRTVFGVGAPRADLLVVGEAPGAEEDRRGEPFVGRAGKLLDAMFHAIGLSRDAGLFITNILKCRPPNNRDPRPEEAAQCGDHLQAQIELLRPRLILCVGRIAAQRLLETDTPIGRMRGREYARGAVPVVVTYHPAYLLRAPGEKRKAWEDLKRVRRLLDAPAR